MAKFIPSSVLAWLKLLFIAATAFALAVGAAEAAAKLLASPFSDVAPKLKGKPEISCDEAPPAPVVTLGVTSMYKQDDPSRSTIDEDQLDDYLEGMKPIRAYLSEVTGYTSNYVASGGAKPKYAICALVFLDAWAKGGALTKLTTRQAALSSTRIVSGMALAYLVARPVAEAIGYDTSDIEAWFHDIAARFVATYDKSGDLNSNSANHRYWGGLAVAASGVVTGDADYLNWGIESYRIGVCQIAADGSLPRELLRKKKARDYHLVATAPLIMTAEIAAANGQDAYGFCGGAIHRLVAFTLGAVKHPELIERLTGAHMVALPMRDGQPRGDRFAWVEPYFHRFGGSEQTYGFQLKRPLFSSSLGGRLTAYVNAKTN